MGGTIVDYLIIYLSKVLTHTVIYTPIFQHTLEWAMRRQCNTCNNTPSNPRGPDDREKKAARRGLMGIAEV